MDNVLIIWTVIASQNMISCVQIVKNNASQPGFYICIKVMSSIF